MPAKSRFQLAAVGFLALSWLASGVSACATQPAKQLPPRLDAYGDALPAGALARLGTSRLRHASGICSLVFSPQGNVLASASQDRTIRLWDSATGKETCRFAGHQSAVRCAVFSPDGKRLISGSWDSTIRLWEVQSGNELGCFQGLLAPVVAFSPDGKTIAAGEVGLVDFCDAATGTVLRTFTDFDKDHQHVSSIAYAPDGTTIAIGTATRVQLLNPTTGKKGLSLAATRPVNLFFSPDSKTLISGQLLDFKKNDAEASTLTNRPYLGTVQIWEVSSGKTIKEWQWPASAHSEVALSPDGKQLAASAEDCTILIWEMPTGRVLRRLEACRDHPGCLAFSPDGKTLAAEAGASAIHLWDLTTGMKLHKNPHQCIPSVALSPTSQLLATTDGGPDVFLWELPAGKPLPTLTAPGGVAFCIGFTPDGQRLVWGSTQSGKNKQLTTINVWSVVQGKEILSWQSAEYLNSVSLSPDGRWLASIGSAIRLWNVQTGKQHPTFKGPEGQVPIAFSPDGKILAAAFCNVLRWWDVSSGKEIGSLPMNWNPHEVLDLFFATADLAFVANGNFIHLYDLARKNKVSTVNAEGEFSCISLAPYGKILATSTAGEDTLRFWDLPSAKVIGELNFKDSPGVLQRFSPDGRNLLVCGKTLSLVEVATGKVRQRLEGLDGYIDSAKVSTNGKYLITVNSDTTILVWDLLKPFPGEKHRPATVGTKELADWWSDLKGDNVPQAYRAIKHMVAAADVTLSFLQERLKPFVQTDPPRTAALVADLDSPSFKVREIASKNLKELGFLAEPALRHALEGSPTLEMRLRVDRAIQQLPDPLEDRDYLRIQRSLEVVELIGTQKARDYLSALIKGTPGTRFAIEAQRALARLDLHWRNGP